MKATVKRHAKRLYHVIFKAPSNVFGAVGFIVVGWKKGSWQLFNVLNTEINCGATKKSMVDYLEGKTEAQLLELNTRR
jgi:hypothetical protein